MKKSFMVVALTVIVVWAQMPTVGNASTVIMNTCPLETSFNCVVGIDGLNILGIDYDMTVVTGEFNTLFTDPGSQLLSWGDPVFAAAATVAITQAMNDLNPLPTSLDTKWGDSLPFDYYETLLHLPVSYSMAGLFETFDGSCASIGETGTGISLCQFFPRDDTMVFASITTSVIPIPPAIWLFCSGLIGFIGIAKRKKT